MTVEDSGVIDIVGTDKATGDVILSISDHLGWAPELREHHAASLREKVESYLRFIRSGQVREEYPNSAGRRVRVEIVHRHVPDAAALELLLALGQTAKSEGVELSWSVFGTEESASA